MWMTTQWKVWHLTHWALSQLSNAAEWEGEESRCLTVSSGRKATSNTEHIHYKSTTHSNVFLNTLNKFTFSQGLGKKQASCSILVSLQRRSHICIQLIKLSCSYSSLTTHVTLIRPGPFQAPSVWNQASGTYQETYNPPNLEISILALEGKSSLFSLIFIRHLFKQHYSQIGPMTRFRCNQH